MVRTLAEDGRPYDPGTRTAFDVADLELARRRAGVELRSGDILIVHTGFAALVSQSFLVGSSTGGPDDGNPWDRARRGDVPLPLGRARHRGRLGHVRGRGVPPERSRPTGFLHRMLIGQFGMALGELWWTEDLAADCAADGVYEAFFTAAPINGPGAIGSPANALAIK